MRCACSHCQRQGGCNGWSGRWSTALMLSDIITESVRLREVVSDDEVDLDRGQEWVCPAGHHQLETQRSDKMNRNLCSVSSCINTVIAAWVMRLIYHFLRKLSIVPLSTSSLDPFLTPPSHSASRACRTGRPALDLHRLISPAAGCTLK